jgi:hypothetical protein
MLLHPRLQVIYDHTAAVRAGRVQCGCTICPRCEGIPDAFKIHDRWWRTYRVVVERLVHCVSALVVRWKCGLCGQTFSPCPDFALPYKRYVCAVVLDFGAHYLGDDAMSYRRAVRVEDLPVFYDSGHQDAIDERTLAGSTLHRWLGWLGRLERTLHAALRLIRRASATSGLFRKTHPVPSWKYRSAERRQRLQVGLGLVSAETAYRSLFAVSIFPGLATRTGWS